MTVSIVMTTYNGEKYLIEQMDSLRLQTLRADEVLIFDDLSSDDTVALTQKYINKWKLTNWKVTVNPSNKGYRLNFLEGAMEASGDVIFYCDQDDVWETNKVELVLNCFHDPNVMVLAHENVIFNEHGESDYRVLNAQNKASGKLTQCDILHKCKRIADSGHTMAFRKSFRDEVVPKMIRDEGMRFDEGLAALAALRGQFYVLHLPLVRHRIHTTNSSTGYWTARSRIHDIDRQIASRKARISRQKGYMEYFGTGGGRIFAY